MKLLFVINSLGAGGAEYSQKALWEYLMDQGIDFRVVVLKKKKVGIAKVLSPGLENRCRMLDGNLMGQYFGLKSVIAEYRPDIVHTTLWRAHFLVRLLRVTGGDFIHLESLVNTTYAKARMSDPNIHPLKLRLLKRIDGWTIQAGADAWHALTHTVAGHYRREFGLPEEKIHIIPRGRPKNSYIGDEQNRKTIRSSFQLDEDELFIINVGRLEYQKGQDFLLRALSILKEKSLAGGWKAVILGREGNFSPVLNKLKDELGLTEDDVVFAGHRYDIERILAAGDLFVFPSRYEGQGGALIEAMASGLPVLCPDLRVFEEVLGKEYGPWLYPAGDIDALTGQLAGWINEEKVRKKASEMAAERFEKEFRLEQIHPAMSNLYRNLIEKQRK